jgi:putative intracellular protease/amidase
VSVQSAQPLNERRQGRNEDENGHTTAVCHGTDGCASSGRVSVGG